MTQAEPTTKPTQTPAGLSTGPWTVGEKPAFSHTRSMLPIRDADGKVVAYIVNRKEGQTEANARAIASVPAMQSKLAAYEKALNEIAAFNSSEGYIAVRALEEKPPEES